MKYIITIFIIGFSFVSITAEALRDNTDTPEKQMEASIRLLLEKINSHEVMKPEDYLVEFSPLNETTSGNLTEGQEYGGGRFFTSDTDPKRMSLIQSLNNFNTLYNNTTNANGQTQLFAFVGRYYLGYRKNRQGVAGINPLTNEEKEKKILDALAKKLNDNANVSDPKRFEQDWIAMLDNKFEDYASVANVTTANGKKVLLFIYIEFVMSESDINPDYDEATEKIKPNIKIYKHQTGLLWNRGLDPFQWAQFNKKDNTAFNFFASQLQFDSQIGLTNPEAFTLCTDKVKDLYGSSFDLNDRSVITSLVNSMSCEKVQEIDITKRKSLLVKLENGILDDFRYSDIVNSKELAALKLLRCTPQAQIDDLLNWLYQTNGLAFSNKKLLNSFFDKIDGKNHVDYITTITNLLYKSNTVGNATLRLINNENILERSVHVSDESLFAKQYNGKQECTAKFIENSADISYTLKQIQELSYLKYSNVPTPSGGGIVGIEPAKYIYLAGTENTPAQLHPYDWVYVYDDGTGVQLTDTYIQTIISDQGKIAKVVPAIYLVYASNERFKSNTIQGIAIAADVLAIATGPGALLKAYRGGQIALAIFEAAQLVGSGANVIVNVTAADPEIKAIVDKYNILVGVAALPQLAVGGVKLAKNCFEQASNVKGLAIADLSTWRSMYNTSKETIKGLNSTVLSDAGKLQLEKFDNYLLAKGVAAVNLFSDFEQRVNDIGHAFKKATSTITKSNGSDLLATVLGKKIKFNDSFSEFNTVIPNDAKKFYDISEVEIDGLVVSADNMQMWKTTDGKLGYNCTGVFCFTENTPLETGELLTQKQEGDLIETTNPSTGQRVLAKIEKIRRGFTRTLTHLLIAGQTLSLTPAHALQTNDGLWVQAGKLQGGDQLKTLQGIITIEDACTETVESTPVISYELENNIPYFVGKMPVLAAGTCDLKTIFSQLTQSERDVFKSSLRGLSTVSQREDVILELAKVSNATDLKILVSTLSNNDNMAAWQILKKNGRVGSGSTIPDALVRNPDAIIALANIRKNPQLGRLKLTDDILGTIKGHTQASYADVVNDLDDLGKFLEANPATNLVEIEKRIATLTKDGTNTSQGVHGVIKEIIENKNLYKDKILQFEVSVPNNNIGSNTPSRFDIAIKDAQNNITLAIERKWLSTGKITNENILSEFINRDLFNIDDLSKLRWSVKGQASTSIEIGVLLKNNKDALNDVLTKLINQGNSQRVTSFKQWFGMGLGNTIIDANIDTFLSNNYTNIFKFN